MNTATEHHYATGTCNPARHCAEHEIDEFAFKPYLICGECFHCFKSGFELWRVYVGEFYGCVWRAWRKGWAPPGTGWVDGARALVGVPFSRPSRIAWCPHCLHDF